MSSSKAAGNLTSDPYSRR